MNTPSRGYLTICSLLLMCSLIISGCNSTAYTRSKQLIAKLQAKLIGDKIGKFKADVLALSSTIDELNGEIELDGHTFTFQTVIGTDNTFTAWVDEKSPPNSTGQTTILGSAKISGVLSPDKRTIKSGDWEATLPNGRGGKERFKGSVDGTDGVPNIASSSVSNDMEKLIQPKRTGCQWDAASNYFEGAVVTYEGKTYTLLSKYLMGGGIWLESLSNPKLGVTTKTWKEGGRCGSIPEVTFEELNCTILPNGKAAVEISGSVTVNGYGAAVVVWAEENRNFGSTTNSYPYGIVNTNYKMMCPGWGKLSSNLRSGSNYSVCVRNRDQPERVTFTASYMMNSQVAKHVNFAALSVGPFILESYDSLVGIPGSIVKPRVSEFSMAPMKCR